MTHNVSRSCSGNSELSLVQRAATPHWMNPRLRFNPQARGLTSAQRQEVMRRDAYRCSTPGCPNHLWLDVHHIVFYCQGGATVPANLLLVCSRCHKHLHEVRLAVAGTAPGALAWTSLLGGTLPTWRGLDGWLGLILPRPPE